jgi:mRNA interferase RelE/StbE
VRGGFQVEVPNRVRKEMRVLPDFVLERVIEALRGLALDPFPQGVKKLQDRPEYRVRVGDYRILYEVDTQARVIVISAVLHRSDAYG